MKTFEEGDRVTHKTYGDGTVITPRYGTGWPTVQFDSGEKIMTSDELLTPVPTAPAAPFKHGDRVQHFLHGTATVVAYDTSHRLVEIKPDGYGGGTASVHPKSLSPIPPEPKFMVRVMFANGVEVNAGAKTQEQVNTYLTNLSDWGTVESININRLKGNR